MAAATGPGQPEAAPPASTELRNDRTRDIDQVGTAELLGMLNAEDATVAGAVAVVLPVLAEVVDATVTRLRSGGQVHYFGAGSSGRIGVLDAAEVVPTFGVPPGVFVAHHAGGTGAVEQAAEGAEDQQSLGAKAAAGLTGADVAVGLSASGRTPYVGGALRAARAAGALTVLVSSNVAAPLLDDADYCVLADTGPEAIAGSTRLKAATAQKMILNSLSTAVMVRLGRTYSNLMVSLAGTNEKLRRRQVLILTEVSGASEQECRSALARCDGDLAIAMLCLLAGMEPRTAARALAEADGSVRAALAAAGHRDDDGFGPAGTASEPAPGYSRLVTTVPPPALTAVYGSLPGHPAGGYPAVSGLLMRYLSDGFPPAIAVEVRTAAGLSYAAAGGWAKLAGADDQPRAAPVPATPSTLFDLASLTKVVGTLPLALLLHQQGRWSIDDPVGRWLPGAPPSPVTIGDCLLHSSGIAAHRMFYLMFERAADIRQAVIAELASAIPAGVVSYSDLGFMLLGWAVEECAGEPLDVLVRREVLDPLGMTNTTYRPQAPLSQIAATEAGGDQRSRPGPAWGAVHDGNAFALGGVSGHAGLFGTARDLGRYAAALLTPARHPVLSAATLELMTSRRAGTGESARVLGWRIDPSGLGDWPAGTLWHTGFTGTSLLISPAADTAAVLLANAVHPVRRPDDIGLFRAQVHKAIRAASAGSVR